MKRKISKAISWISVVIFILSMIPILYLSFFNYATGDDLNKSCATHLVLMNGGSLSDFVAGALSEIGSFYNGWGGNWFACALWTVEPSIFGEDVYHITLYIALLAILGGIGYLSYYWYQKYIKADKCYFVIMLMMLFFVTVQSMPAGHTAFFWYAVIANYIIPYALTLLTAVWIDKWLENGKWTYIIGVTVAGIMIGGAGYMEALVQFEILVLFLIYCVIRKAKFKRIFGVLIPFIGFAISFAFNLLAPGNAARGGESIDLGLGNIIITIKDSILRGASNTVEYFLNGRLLFIYVPLLIAIAWLCIDLKTSDYKYEYPIIKIVIGFLMYCSTYAPMSFMKDIDGSSGHTNSYWLYFILWITYTIVYLVGYIKVSILSKEKTCLSTNRSTAFDYACLGISVGIVLISCCLYKHFLGNMYSYKCYDYIVSGRLSDFEEQMQERFVLLNDPKVDDVVVPMMNDDQGPFLHFAITDDPTVYTNYVTADFYGKNSVIAMPRDEYYERYQNGGMN